MEKLSHELDNTTCLCILAHCNDNTKDGQWKNKTTKASVSEFCVRLPWVKGIVASDELFSLLLRLQTRCVSV